MRLESPHLQNSVPATADNISKLIASIVGAKHPIAIVAKDDMTYVQTAWLKGGFLLEYQIGSLDRHFISDRSDFTAQEVAAILSAYAADSPKWAQGIAFAPMKLPGPFMLRFLNVVGKIFKHAGGARHRGSSRHA